MISVKNLAVPTTFDEACRRQRQIHLLMDRGEVKFGPGEKFREASMKPGYVMAHAPELGMGLFSTLNGVAHECNGKMKWSEDGGALLCTICWRDGT